MIASLKNPPQRWRQSMKRPVLVQTRITKNKTLILMLLRVSFFFICQQSLPSVLQQFSLHTDMRESVLIISTGLCYSNMWLSMSCIIILRSQDRCYNRLTAGQD